MLRFFKIVGSNFGNMLRFFRGQGATEYLVLLAVVLLIALVSIALLGLMPEFARDARQTELDMYWQSAYPIGIIETAPAYFFSTTYPNTVMFRVKNNGANKIKIVNLLSGNRSTGATSGNPTTIIDFYSMVLSPGEEGCFANQRHPQMGMCGVSSVSPFGNNIFIVDSGFSAWYDRRFLLGATSSCNADGSGTVIVPDFGFEYYEYYDEGKSIKQKQWGKELVLPCYRA